MQVVLVWQRETEAAAASSALTAAQPDINPLKNPRERKHEVINAQFQPDARQRLPRFIPVRVSVDAGAASSPRGCYSHGQQEEEDAARVGRRGQVPPRLDEVSQDAEQGDADGEPHTGQRPWRGKK